LECVKSVAAILEQVINLKYAVGAIAKNTGNKGNKSRKIFLLNKERSGLYA